MEQDPRLVAVYNSVNPIDECEAFYLDLASKLSASTVIDMLVITGGRERKYLGLGEHPLGIFTKGDFDGHTEIVARRRCEFLAERSTSRALLDKNGSRPAGPERFGLRARRPVLALWQGRQHAVQDGGIRPVARC